jgi:hypothetical protein
MALSYHDDALASPVDANLRPHDRRFTLAIDRDRWSGGTKSHRAQP